LFISHRGLLSVRSGRLPVWLTPLRGAGLPPRLARRDGLKAPFLPNGRRYCALAAKHPRLHREGARRSGGEGGQAVSPRRAGAIGPNGVKPGLGRIISTHTGTTFWFNKNCSCFLQRLYS